MNLSEYPMNSYFYDLYMRLQKMTFNQRNILTFKSVDLKFTVSVVCL